MTNEELTIAFALILLCGIAFNVILTLITHGSCGKK